MTESSDAPERKGARPARNAEPSLLELAIRILRHELTEDEAVRILRQRQSDDSRSSDA